MKYEIYILKKHNRQPKIILLNKFIRIERRGGVAAHKHLFQWYFEINVVYSLDTCLKNQINSNKNIVSQ